METLNKIEDHAHIHASHISEKLSSLYTHD